MQDTGYTPHPLLILALVGALLGFIFAGFSTYDFEQHLDRQVHSVHCSFVPGLSEEEAGGSDCEVTLMSPYSSVMRDQVWGGVPISLPAMAVFAFMMFFGVDLLLARRQRDSRATGFYALAAVLPALSSTVMGYISLGELDAACKLCIGIYVASGLTLTGAVGLWIRARSSGPIDVPGLEDEPAWAEESADSGAEDQPLETNPESWGESDSSGGKVSWAKLIGAFGLGIIFVAVPVGAYMVTAPDHSKFIGTCGTLDEEPADELLVEMGPQNGVPTLEVFDPLCPACRGFEEHLQQTPYDDKLARKAVMFPLDDECNWMLDRSVHPGACTVSEAVLCAENDANRVVEWAFAHQEEIHKAAKENPDAAEQLVEEQFPELASCVGSPKVKQKLNRSLRWAVDNELRILTPQVYVDGVRLCDEDVDLGMEFALSRMIEMSKNGTLRDKAEEAEAEAESVPADDEDEQQEAK
jgi:uncharacterized membrane protein